MPKTTEHKKYVISLMRVIKKELDKTYPATDYLEEKIDKLKEVSFDIARIKRMKK